MPRKAKTARAVDKLGKTPDFPVVEKKRMGRPPHQPTDLSRRTVALACFSGMTHEQIARLIEVDEGTLRKHYQEELTRGADKIAAAVAGNLVTIATQQQDRKAALTAAIFICKARLRWRDRDPFDAEAEAKVKKLPDGEESVTVTLRIGDRPDDAD